jgi:hypothetical protein
VSHDAGQAAVTRTTQAARRGQAGLTTSRVKLAGTWTTRVPAGQAAAVTERCCGHDSWLTCRPSSRSSITHHLLLLLQWLFRSCSAYLIQAPPFAPTTLRCCAGTCCSQPGGQALLAAA